MSAKDEAEKAKEQAEQAATQARAAARSGARALREAAEPVVEAVADEAQDVAEKVEGTAEDAVEAARRVNVGVLGKMSSDVGVGFLALSVCIYSGAVAYVKFRQAASGGSQVISNG